MRFISAVVSAIVCVALTFSARAGTLGLTGGVSVAPDIFSPDLTATYSGNVLHIFGMPFDMYSYNSIPGAPFESTIPNANFDLIANINPGGTLNPVGSTLTITGGATPVDEVLTGNLTDIGAVAGGIIEFKFDVTGGSLAGDFGSKGGLIFSASGIATGTFTEDLSMAFTTKDDSKADTIAVAAVPTPATVYGGFTLLVGWLGYQSRKRMGRALGQ